MGEAIENAGLRNDRPDIAAGKCKAVFSRLVFGPSFSSAAFSSMSTIGWMCGVKLNENRILKNSEN